MTRELTTQQLAAAARTPVESMAEILEDERRRGNVVEADGRWSLTTAGERRYGRLLRDIDNVT